MRFNDSALRVISRSVSEPEKEGRMLYRAPRDSYRERWFRLKGNLLFFYKTNEHGIICEPEACGLIYMEMCKMQEEPMADRPFVFSILFQGEGDKKHYFSAQSVQQCHDWITALTKASHQHIKAHLKTLQTKIMKMTGRDPIPAMREASWPQHEEKMSSILPDRHQTSSVTRDELIMSKTSTFYRPSNNQNHSATGISEFGRESKPGPTTFYEHSSNQKPVPIRGVSSLKPRESSQTLPYTSAKRTIPDTKGSDYRDSPPIFEAMPAKSDMPLIQFDGMDLRDVPNVNCNTAHNFFTNSQPSQVNSIPRPSSFAGFEKSSGNVSITATQRDRPKSKSPIPDSIASAFGNLTAKAKSAFTLNQNDPKASGWETFD